MNRFFHKIISENSPDQLEQLLSTMLEQSVDGICIIDDQYQIIGSNDAFKAMVRYSADSIQSLNLKEVDTQLTTESNLGQHQYFSKNSSCFERQLMRRDGSIFPAQVSTSIASDTHQTFAFLMVRDISDENASNAALLEFKSIVDKTFDCVFIFTPDTLKFTYINRGAREQVGYSFDELSNMHPYDIKPHFDEAKFRKFVQPLLDNDVDSLSFDTVHQHKDGHLVDVNILLQLVTAESGVQRFIAIVRDVSEYKTLQEQLRHSQKMEAIGRLAGGVAHDFNNQLAAIMGYAELISHKSDDSDILNYSKRISEASQVSKKLTEQLLTFSRKNELQLATVNVHDLINETMQFLNHTMSKQITVGANLEATAFHVVADKALLKTAILNIALNARDAMPDGGYLFINTARLPFAEFKDEKYGEAIQITISDTGFGIAQDKLLQIFEPFYTTKPQGKGTGLGLSSVKGTIEQHGGIIGVSSDEGKGTTFTITLPVLSSESIDDIEISEPVIEKTASNKTILLVDDEPLVNNVCTELLSLLGYSVISVNCGKDAVATYLAQGDEIDLVILDYMMPEMDGLKTFKLLKNADPTVKAIISSGYLADANITDLKQQGILDVISKPFTLDELKQVLEKIDC